MNKNIYNAYNIHYIIYSEIYNKSAKLEFKSRSLQFETALCGL